MRMHYREKQRFKKGYKAARGFAKLRGKEPKRKALERLLDKARSIGGDIEKYSKFGEDTYNEMKGYSYGLANDC